MTRDKLQTVLKLRRLAMEEARRELTACLRREDAMLREAEEADRAIAGEIRAAADIAAGDARVDTLAAWLPGARRRAALAWERQAEAAAATACARTALTLARAAAEAAEQSLERRRAEQAAEAARRAQAELDEAGRPRANSSGSSLAKRPGCGETPRLSAGEPGCESR